MQISFISSHIFGSEVIRFGGDSVLALTDVGPPNGRQLSMLFDLGDDAMTMDAFRITAAHEFGHFLGISHRDVNSTGDLMSPNLNSASPVPTQNDLRAASRHWALS